MQEITNIYNKSNQNQKDKDLKLIETGIDVKFDQENQFQIKQKKSELQNNMDIFQQKLAYQVKITIINNHSITSKKIEDLNNSILSIQRTIQSHQRRLGKQQQIKQRTIMRQNAIKSEIDKLKTTNSQLKDELFKINQMIKQFKNQSYKTEWQEQHLKDVQKYQQQILMINEQIQDGVNKHKIEIQNLTNDFAKVSEETSKRVKIAIQGKDEIIKNLKISLDLNKQKMQMISAAFQ